MKEKMKSKIGRTATLQLTDGKIYGKIISPTSTYVIVDIQESTPEYKKGLLCIPYGKIKSMED